MPSPGQPSNHLRIEQLYGVHAGETIFVIGTSASLVGINLDLIKDYTKIGINRVIRLLPCQYVQMSETDAFLAVEEEIKEQGCILFMYYPTAEVLAPKLNGITVCKIRLQDRDEHLMQRLGQPGEPLFEPVLPDNPFIRYYPNGFKRLPNARRRIKEPGSIQHDGILLRSNSNCVYAVEMAYRMLRDGKGTPGRCVLLGIDLRSDKVPGGKSLTYIPEINTLHRRDMSCHLPPTERVVPHLRRAMEVMEEDDIELLNASTWSGPLDEFIPRLPLEQIIGQ